MLSRFASNSLRKVSSLSLSAFTLCSSLREASFAAVRSRIIVTTQSSPSSSTRTADNIAGIRRPSGITKSTSMLRTTPSADNAIAKLLMLLLAGPDLALALAGIVEVLLPVSEFARIAG